MSKRPKPPLMLRVVFLSKMLDHMLEHQLANRGVNRTQTIVLTTLAHHEGLKAADLCAHARVEAANVTRTLQSLERQDLVERRPHPTDGRVSLFFLTETGRATARQLSSEIDSFSNRIMGEMGEENVLLLEKSLESLWQVVHDWMVASGRHPAIHNHEAQDTAVSNQPGDE